MQRPSKKPRIILALAAAVTLTGCAALRFGYNQAPEFSYWWLNRYVDFDETQASQARDAIGQWFRWHRTSQLPGYADGIAQASREVLEPTTAEKVCKWQDELWDRVPALVDRGVPAAADFVLTLKPEQFKNIAARFDKVNRDFRADHVQASKEKRLDAEVERLEDRAKSLYGSLSSAQRDRLREQVAASPFDAERWEAERRARQQEILQTLQKLHADKATPQQAQAAIRTIFEHVERSPREAYRSYSAKLKTAYCTLAADLHNSTTPEQRRTAQRKLKGWETDLRVLSTAQP